MTQGARQFPATNPPSTTVPQEQAPPPPPPFPPLQVVFGCEPHELSLAYVVAYCRAAGSLDALLETSENGGQEFRVSGGAFQIARRLADSVGEDNVHLSTPVAHIQQDVDGARVQSVDGHVWRASRVVLATPPHLVSRITHAPALPSWRDQLGQRMPMGHLMKVVISYSQGFWRQKGFSGNLVSSKGPLCTVFDATSADGLSPAIVAFIGGSQATEWAARPAVERRLAVLQQLALAFHDDGALDPIDYVEQDWAREPYNGGCPVARMNTGVMSTLAHRLRLPIGRLHFAGTELADSWTGYIDGAVQSGERAAREVVAVTLSARRGEGEEQPAGAPQDGVDRGLPPRPLFRPEPLSVFSWSTLRLPAAGVLGGFVALAATARFAARGL